MFREFWARSAHFGQNGGWDESRAARVFLCGNPEDLSATSQRPIFTKFGHETSIKKSGHSINHVLPIVSRPIALSLY